MSVVAWVAAGLLMASTSISTEQQTLTHLLAEAASRRVTLEVTTQADMRELLELEGQKQSLGNCDPDDLSSCLAEIAAALGTRYVLRGELGALGEERTLALTLIDTEKVSGAKRRLLRGNNIDALAQAAEAALPGLLDELPTPKKGAPRTRLLVLDVRGATIDADGPPPPPAGPTAWLWSGGIVAGGGLLLLGSAAVGEFMLQDLRTRIVDKGTGQVEAVALEGQRGSLAPWVQGAWIAGAAAAALGIGLVAVGIAE